MACLLLLVPESHARPLLSMVTKATASNVDLDAVQQDHGAIWHSKEDSEDAAKTWLAE